MSDRDPGPDEWICRRCGSIQDRSVSVCTECGSPSSPDSAGFPGTHGRDAGQPLDWTALVLAILIALLIVGLAIVVSG